mmetsp:Transcript_4632/g.5893  ORF Transcript_4632/g.5893 Transcript_4632/m.5893 type:complete len:152 (+) Transcript_4632:327-782(+)
MMTANSTLRKEMFTLIFYGITTRSKFPIYQSNQHNEACLQRGILNGTSWSTPLWPTYSFFLEQSTFEAFIRNSTLLPAHDACLLAQWSFAQKLTRPGRYYICSSLDEGAFFNSGKGRRVNVYIEDARDLRYYATRNIAKGEEIIYSSAVKW